MDEKTQIVRLNPQQIADIITAHLATHRRAWCLPDNATYPQITYLIGADGLEAVDVTVMKKVSHGL
jgi:hypothetical protein